MLTTDLILAIFNAVLPTITSIIKNHQANNGGAMPTDAQILAEFNANIDGYLAEGAAWRAAHPKV